MMKQHSQVPRPSKTFENGAAIEFFRGPLDGSLIFTDEYPNTDYLIHRHGGREHLYRYYSTKSGRFRAEYDGYLCVETPPHDDAPNRFRRWSAAFKRIVLTAAREPIRRIVILFRSLDRLDLSATKPERVREESSQR